MQFNRAQGECFLCFEGGGARSDSKLALQPIVCLQAPNLPLASSQLSLPRQLDQETQLGRTQGETNLYLDASEVEGLGKEILHRGLMFELKFAKQKPVQY